MSVHVSAFISHLFHVILLAFFLVLILLVFLLVLFLLLVLLVEVWQVEAPVFALLGLFAVTAFAHDQYSASRMMYQVAVGCHVRP